MSARPDPPLPNQGEADALADEVRSRLDLEFGTKPHAAVVTILAELIEVVPRVPPEPGRQLWDLVTELEIEAFGDCKITATWEQRARRERGRPE